MQAVRFQHSGGWGPVPAVMHFRAEEQALLEAFSTPCGDRDAGAGRRTFHAATLPPRRSRASSTMGMCPASARYLAVDSPASPAPAMTTRSGLSGRGADFSSAGTHGNCIASGGAASHGRWRASCDTRRLGTTVRRLDGWKNPHDSQWNLSHPHVWAGCQRPQPMHMAAWRVGLHLWRALPHQESHPCCRSPGEGSPRSGPADKQKPVLPFLQVQRMQTSPADLPRMQARHACRASSCAMAAGAQFRLDAKSVQAGPAEQSARMQLPGPGMT